MLPEGCSAPGVLCRGHTGLVCSAHRTLDDWCDDTNSGNVSIHAAVSILCNNHANDLFDDLFDNLKRGGNAVIRVGLGQGATHRNPGSAR
jgi:hypothetical protein